MIPYSSSAKQQVGVHDIFDPGHQKDWVNVAEKSQRGGNPRMTDDGNEEWGRSL